MMQKTMVDHLKASEGEPAAVKEAENVREEHLVRESAKFTFQVKVEFFTGG